MFFVCLEVLDYFCRVVVNLINFFGGWKKMIG
jgi:hypothetical protein